MGLFTSLIFIGLPALAALFVAYLIDKQRKHLLSQTIRIASWVIAIIAYAIAVMLLFDTLENDGFEGFSIFLGPPIFSLVLFFCIQQFGQKKNNNEKDLKN